MKKFKSICLLMLIISIFITPISVKAEENKKIILIDPGHGGFDGGAKSKAGTIEKDINLQISLRLKENLEEQGYIVFLTRESDEDLGNSSKTIREKKREDLKKRRDMKARLNVMFLYQYIKICFKKLSVMEHKYGIVQMK